MKKSLIFLFVFASLSGYSQIVRTLSNVNNTADSSKPVSNAQQVALSLKANLSLVSNVNNTSDANKPVSTAQQTAFNLKANLASPTFTGTVQGITAAMVGLGNVDNTSDANKPVPTAVTTSLGLKANLASPTFTGTVSGITSTMVGLGNVDNTSDVNKPVSSATSTALGLKQNTLSGTGFVKSTAGTITYDASTYLSSITSGNVTTALGFTPYNASNPSGYISSVPAQTFTSLTGKPTTLVGYGITDSYPLTGNPSNFLTSITSGNVTTALGFTPYNATNPSGYTTLSAVSSVYTPIASPVHTGDIETSTLNAGVIVKSPNGTRFRLTVSNNGDIIATSL